MNILAIIPARGGSKGIPRKNIKLLCGMPLIGYTIEAAINSEYVTRVVVSTDDAEIKACSIDMGAEVIDRPSDISGDKASSEQALLHVIDVLEKGEGYKPDIIVFLQCTSPFTRACDIDGAVRTYIYKNADSLFTAFEFHGMLWHDIKGNMDGINHDKSKRLMRQDMDTQYLENGAIYVMNATGFRVAKHRFFGKTSAYLMDASRSVEIDDPSDWVKVEFLMQFLKRVEQQSHLPLDIELVVFDFDGVFTDNKVIVLPDGNEAVICDRGDGMGISMLKEAGIKTVVVSKEQNNILAKRCEKLNLEYFNPVDNKLVFLKKYLARNGIAKLNTVYVGNDINDRECLNYVGCAVVPADAHEDVKSIASVKLCKNGGNGAIRELVDLILKR
ncbi:MAG: cytidylyltransferase domain-containing protein [Sedimentisphaeraceae bacterium JB056]